MKSAVRLILLGLWIGVSGCASGLSLGEPVNDASRQAALLGAYRRPEVPQAVFRTVIRWGGREISLTEVVKVSARGSLSVAGMTDIGNTLYAAQIDPSGQGRILSKSLPFSDRWLLEGLIAELLIPWRGPNSACPLYKQADETWALACTEDRVTRVFLFDAAGQWRQLCRLSGSRLLSRTALEWDDQPIPKTMRVDNPSKHYHAVREYLSTR